MKHQISGLTQVIATDPSRLVNIFNPTINQIVTLHPKTEEFPGSKVLFTGYNGITGFNQDICARFVGLDSNGDLVLTFSDTIRQDLERMGAIHIVFERNKHSQLEEDGYEVGSLFDYKVTVTPQFFMNLVASYGCIPINEDPIEN